MSWLNSILAKNDAPGDRGAVNSPAARRQRIGLTQDVADGLGGLDGMRAAFPSVDFVVAGSEWANANAAGLSILVVGLGAADIEPAAGRIRTSPRGLDIVIVLSGGGIEATRTLLRAGAGDVIAHPVSEAALALSIERLMSQQKPVEMPSQSAAGQVTVFLKAGGGVGATALCLLTALRLADKHPGRVAVADLDLQAGSAAAQLGLPESFTVRDLLAAGSALEDTPFSRALQTHAASGLRLLASPADVTPLEAVTPVQADAMIRGLRREFGHVLVDLPAAWTAWTHRLSQQADRIVLVTRMSVPHINVARRQLKFLAEQGLAQKPITLACNAVAADQSSKLPLKWAEKPLSRSFDISIPDDQRTLEAFVNEGTRPAERGASAKLAAAINRLADAVGAPVATILNAAE